MIRALTLALAVAASACAPTLGEAYLDSFGAGQRAYHAGRYGEAARSFADAAARAERVKDRDEARLMEARSYQKAQDWARARGAYQKLLADSPSGPRSPRAEFELAELAIEHGDVEAGWAMLRAAVHKNPSHGVAARALRSLVQREEDRGGPAAAVAWLRREAPALRKTELDQPIQYELGLALERSGDREGAVRALVATARAHPYPFGALTDNALFRAAEIAADLGRPEEAIGYLREMLSPRERSAGGSYQRPLFDDAQRLIATLYRDALKDRAAARREFHRLYADHPASLMRDDALWEEALLFRADALESEVCSTVKRLSREFPESRYARCVHQLCPALPTAEKPCAGYIERQINGDGEDRGGAED